MLKYCTSRASRVRGLRFTGLLAEAGFMKVKSQTGFRV